MIEVKITGETMADIFEQFNMHRFADLVSDTPDEEFPPSEPQADPTTWEPQDSTTKAIEKDTKPEQKKSKESEKEPKKAETITKPMIQSRAKEILDAGKRDDLKSAFDEFGAQRLSQIKEADYTKFYQFLGDVLNA